MKKGCKWWFFVKYRGLFCLQVAKFFSKKGEKIENAGDRGRTGTMLPPRDFKSRASANSATPASFKVITLYPNKDRKSSLFQRLCHLLLVLKAEHRDIVKLRGIPHELVNICAKSREKLIRLHIYVIVQKCRKSLHSVKLVL